MSLWKKPPPSVPATDLDRRVQDLLGKSSGGGFVMEPVEDAGFSADVATVRLPMTCGKTGTQFLGIGYIERDIIWLTGSEPAEGQPCDKFPDLPPGSFRIGSNDWICPHCQAELPLWMCACSKFFGALQCRGYDEDDAYQWCGCGKFCGRFLYRKGKPKGRFILDSWDRWKYGGSEQFLSVLQPIPRKPDENLSNSARDRPFIIGRDGKPVKQEPLPKSPPHCGCDRVGIGYSCRGPITGATCVNREFGWGPAR